ncbi:MAG: hypothetical protein ABJN26_22570 [Stappiaceae bacterium]
MTKHIFAFLFLGFLGSTATVVYAQDKELDACRGLGLSGLVKQWMETGIVEKTIIAYCDDYGTLKRKVKSNEEELAELVPLHRGLLERLNSAERSIAVLQGEVIELNRNIENTERKIPPANSILLVDSTRGCPDGWHDVAESEPTIFEGKTVIAAGDGHNRIPHKFRNVGGQETVIISTDQMPKHVHRMVWGQPSGNLPAPASGNNFTSHEFKGYETKQTTLPTGGDMAHDNMPPYVALYFCKKS